MTSEKRIQKKKKTSLTELKLLISSLNCKEKTMKGAWWACGSPSRYASQDPQEEERETEQENC